MPKIKFEKCKICGKQFQKNKKRIICGDINCKRELNKIACKKYYHKSVLLKSDSYLRKLDYIKRYKKTEKGKEIFNRCKRAYDIRHWNKKQYGEYWECMMIKEQIHKLCKKLVS